MSGKEFFRNRYQSLGYDLMDVKLRQSIRINNMNSKGKNIIQRLARLGVNLEKIPFLHSGYWVVDSKVSVGASAEYLLGFYSVQEAAAQIPVELFSNLKGKKVLDCAAAPGGKTVQLADAMENTGVVISLDVDKRRLIPLSNHLERCQVANTIVYLLDARKAASLEVKFDRILVDAPCSGNFASDKFWFKNRTLQDIERNAAVQREILAKAVDCLNFQGELIYSTCSLEPEEDELNVDWAIKNLDLRVEKIDCYGSPGLTAIFGKQLDASVTLSRRLWPGETQGFFICKLKRGKKL